MSVQPIDPQLSARKGSKRRRLWLLLLLPLIVGAAVYFFWPPAVASPPVINTAGIDPEVAAVLEEAQQRLRENPRSAAAWGELGTVLFASDMYVDASPCLAQAEILDRSNVRWPYLQGLALMDYDRPAAVNCLRRAAGLAGKDFGPHLRLAETLLQEEQLDEAEKEFRKTLELHPGNQRALLGLGRAALSRGVFQESLGQLMLIEDSPVSQRATQAAMAEAYRHLKDEEGAARCEERVRALPPDISWPDPLLNEARTRAVGPVRRLERARDLWKAGDVATCLELLEENLRKQSKDAASWALLGTVQFSQKNLSAAEPALKEAVRLNPEDTNSQLLLGGILLQQKRLVPASEVFRQVLRTRPSSTDAALNLSHCLVEQGDRPGAIEVLRTALRYRPDAAQLHMELGNQLLQAGKAGDAIPLLRQAILLAPSDAQAQKLLDEAQRQARRTP